MKSILWLVALMMILGWGLGFFVWAAPAFIHILLVVGLIIVVYNVMVPKNSEV